MNMRWYDDDFVAAFWISLGITLSAGLFMILVCVPKNTQEGQEVLKTLSGRCDAVRSLVSLGFAVIDNNVLQLPLGTNEAKYVRNYCEKMQKNPGLASDIAHQQALLQQIVMDSK